MTFKNKVDEHPVMVVGTFMVAAFVAGISVMKFVEENRAPHEPSDVITLVQQIREVLDQNVKLTIENAQLKGQISPQKAADTQKKADEIIGGVNIDDIREHGIFGGPNSFFRKPLG